MEGYKKIIYLIGFLFLVSAGLWRFFIAPILTSLPNDFNYQAEVNSVDNFYDEELNLFSGDQYSATTFFYETTSIRDDVLLIKNVFDVKTIDGQDIFAVERHYGVNKKTGSHVAGFGDKDRTGYLFAPRHLKPDQPFTYWHINYDGPATMRFVGEEELFGLPVYHYETNYEGVDIDQTDNLGHLPGVPEERGVRLDPHLEIWVEPVSGYLISYKDDTTAYYYDIDTNERLNPWNNFSNSYKEKSIKDAIGVAEQYKFRIIIFEQVVPLLLIFLALLFFGHSLIYFLGDRVKKIVTRLSDVNLASKIEERNILGSLLVVGSLVMLIGWIFEISVLIHLHPALPGMNYITVMLFLVLGLTLLIRPKKYERYVFAVGGLILIIVSLIRVIAEFGFSFRIDHSFFLNYNFQDDNSYTSSVSLITALEFSLIGLALLISSLKNKIGHYISLSFYILAFIFSILGLISYWVTQIRVVIPVLSDLAFHTTSFFLISSMVLLTVEVRFVWPNFLSFVRRLTLVFLTLFLPAAATFGAWSLSNDYLDQQIESEFELETESIKRDIIFRTSIYINALEGARGLFSASDEVSRAEWDTYVSTLKLQDNYPGIQGMGYGLIVSDLDKDDHIDQVRSSDFPDYNISPDGDRDSYVVVYYLSPLDFRNQRALGYDMSSESVRRQAILSARDSGEPSMSGKITLVQETDTDIQPGFLIYLPVYANGQPSETVEERRQSILGYVYAPFRMNDFMSGIFTSEIEGIDVEVFDGIRVDEDSELYDYDFGKYSKDPSYGAPLIKTETIYIAGHPWTLRFLILPDFKVDGAVKFLPLFVIFVGSVFTFLLFITFFVLLSSRQRAIRYANKLTVELKGSRDDLSKTNKKINQKLNEVERLNKFMIDRELKMIELKNKIKEMTSKKKK